MAGPIEVDEVYRSSDSGWFGDDAERRPSAEVDASLGTVSENAGYDAYEAYDETTVTDLSVEIDNVEPGSQSCATGNAEGGPGCNDRLVCVPETRTLVIDRDNVGDRPCERCQQQWKYMDNVGGTLTYQDDELLVFFRFKTTAVERATETRDLLDAPFGNANILLTLSPPLNDHVGRVVHQYAPRDLTELDRVELVDGTLTVGFELEIDTGGSTVSTPGCWPQDDVGDCYCPYEGFDARASVVVSLPYSGQ